jgi:hypothetical protein
MQNNPIKYFILLFLLISTSSIFGDGKSKFQLSQLTAQIDKSNIVFQKKDLTFLSHRGEAIFFVTDTSQKAKLTNDVFGVFILSDKTKAVLSIYEHEGAIPEIVDVFTCVTGTKSENELFVICKWNQVHREEQINGDAYKVYVYKDSLIKDPSGFNRIAIDASMMKIFGEGFEGIFQGVDTIYPYKTSKDIIDKVQNNKKGGLSLQDCFTSTLNSFKAKKNDCNCAILFVKDSLWKTEPISLKNVGQYNDLGFFLEQGGKYTEAMILLTEVVKTIPERTPAWLNLGDAQKELNKLEDAKKSYTHYVNLMEESGKTAKIPQRVYNFLKQ